ncbi:fetuin-B [Rhynchocyon petersi]
MGLLLPLALCALAMCCGAVSPPQKPFRIFNLSSRGCNDSDILTVAGFALQDINKDQKDGYVLSLNRVSDAWEYRQDSPGALFYLTLDVLETYCHVLSKKPWEDCPVRELHGSVYGQCKVMYYVDKPRRILNLLAYNCTLRPVSGRQIHSMCPDCPSPRPTDLSDPRVLEAATESLAKFNRETPSKQYSLVKVTRASAQWVFGPGYFVEYLVKESPCTQSQASNCPLQPSDSATPAPGEENPAASQKLPEVKEPQHKGTAPTNTSSETVSRGSIQHLPDLDDGKPEDPTKEPTHEAFPVQLDLTTNPQGEDLVFSFLSLGPEKELHVIPFPKRQQTPKCPGPAKEGNRLVLPP